MRPTSPELPKDSIEHLIFTIRGQRVVLDADLADFMACRRFGSTRHSNAIANASRRIFAFSNLRDEFADLKSQIVTSTFELLIARGLRLTHHESVISSRKHRGATYRPWAFTEHAALMAGKHPPVGPRAADERFRSFAPSCGCARSTAEEVSQDR